MTDITKIDRSLILAIIDAVIDVAITVAPFPLNIGLRILRAIVKRHIDEIVADVASRFAVPAGATGAAPPEWKELILAVLAAVAKVTEGLPVVHKTVLALHEAVAGPFFDLVYDLIVLRGQAEPRTSAVTSDLDAQAEALMKLKDGLGAALSA